MESTHPKPVKPEKKLNADAEGAFVQKVDEGKGLELIAQMKEIYW
ncbi:MAG: hypothetical protein AAGE93_03760 [Bacteroidota bacterium]